MNASVRYYEDKFAVLTAKIMVIETELNVIQEQRREYEKLTGKPTREFLGITSTLGKLRYYRNQLEQVKIALSNKANAIIIWHDRNEYLKHTIEELRKDLVGKEAKINDLLSLTQAGIQLKASETEMLLNYGYITKTGERQLKSLVREQEKHKKYGIKESKQYGLDLLSAIRDNDFKQYPDSAPLKAREFNTEIPNLATAGSAEIDSESTVDTISEVEDTISEATSEATEEISDFDREMIAAQSAQRTVHKI